MFFGYQQWFKPDLVDQPISNQDIETPVIGNEPDLTIQDDEVKSQTSDREDSKPAKPIESEPVVKNIPVETKQDNHTPDSISGDNKLDDAKIVDRPETNNDSNDSSIKSELPGALKIVTKQWANIFVDGVAYGSSPLQDPIELSPGAHRVMLNNDEFPTPVFIPIEIESGKDLDMQVDLTTHFATVRILSVKPWAEVYIDDVSYGMTPRARPIFLAFGAHTLELRNPGYPTWREEFELSSSEPAREIVADLIKGN